MAPADGEPDTAVGVNVSQGVYAVVLGDATLPNMTAIPHAVFANSDVRLRVWFNDGVHGSQLLTPDQRLVAVGYAMVAATAATVADGAITAGKIAPGAVGSAALAPGLTLGGTTTGNFSGPLAGNAATATTADTASSFTGSLVGDVTGTQGATVVATVGGVTAANVATGATLANAATAANTPNTIVKRDGSGTIPASQVATAPAGMVLIPAGAFTMGNSVAADTDITDAVPVSTTVSAFYMDVNLVSYSQWQLVQQWGTLVGGYTDLAVGAGKGANHPVHSVGWFDSVKWCNARSEQAGKPPVYFTDAGFTAVYRSGVVPVFANWSARGYRLPTEAEWEKAARGGVAGKRFPWGDTISQKQANYYGDTSYTYDLGPNGFNAIGSLGGTSPATSPVGSFAPNGYGLYDMAGNVFECCWDSYGTPYAGGTDPRGPASGFFRVIRGGNCGIGANYCRSANRSKGDPEARISSRGFRSVLPPGQ